MENIITVENIKELKNKRIYRGFNGTCYLTNDGSVFKLLESPNEEKLERLSKFDSPHFVFPKKLVYDKHGKLLGYLMDYVDGDTISHIPDNFSLPKYINEIEKIENEIAILTNYKLQLVDVGVNNIMYSKGYNIRIIDTDFYEPNSDKKNLYQSNMTHFNYSVMYPICDISELKIHNPELDKYVRYTLGGKMKPSELIDEFSREVYLRGDYPEETIGEFKKQVKKI